MSFDNEHSMVEDLVELSNEEDKGELFVRLAGGSNVQQDSDELFRRIARLRSELPQEETLSQEETQPQESADLPLIKELLDPAPSPENGPSSVESSEECQSKKKTPKVCHAPVQPSSKTKYNCQKGSVTKLINIFRANCQNAEFSQDRWKQLHQKLENQLHKMEENCLILLNLPTLTFIEAIDIRRDFERRKADGNLILCLIQDQLQHFRLDSFSGSSSSGYQTPSSGFPNSRPKKRRLRKRHQRLKSRIPSWKKEAIQAAHDFRNQLKTESFFRRRQFDFELSSSDLASSDSDALPTSTKDSAFTTSCQSSSSSCVLIPGLESVEESSPISDCSVTVPQDIDNQFSASSYYFDDLIDIQFNLEEQSQPESYAEEIGLMSKDIQPTPNSPNRLQ